MTLKTKLIASAAIAFTLSAAAHAQSTDVLNEQLQFDDVWANMNVVMPGEVDGDAVGSAVAYGNVVSAYTTDDGVVVDNTQTTEGDVTATTTMDLNVVSDTTIAVTTAYSNSAVISGENGTTFGLSYQTANGDTTASTDLSVNDTTDLSVGSTSVANVQSIEGIEGDTDAYTEQVVNGSVAAETNIDGGTNTGEGAVITTALGNSLTNTGSSSDNVTSAVQYTNGDEITSTSTVAMENASDLTVASTAGGNTHSVYNEWNYAQIGSAANPAYQQNESAVAATTEVTLENWIGQATSSAYGVGNSALMSNIGADAAIFMDQMNLQTVDAAAALTGNTSQGGTGFVTATAIGNAISGAVCNVCGDAVLTGTVSQTNFAATRASATINVGGSTGGLVGSASAIGNTASYVASAQ